ncbi:hypothetical protein CDAR_527441 [Caerostris darwini]|uniref:Uncharacterized protein n=1 Tax=Caerostris darwini TaxID=1538125 RepID=A0AAV4WK88_9ARAC|nr:hypothetical protein CDAR_527441 [Caerostris darwini]
MDNCHQEFFSLSSKSLRHAKTTNKTNVQILSWERTRFGYAGNVLHSLIRSLAQKEATKKSGEEKIPQSREKLMLTVTHSDLCGIWQEDSRVKTDFSGCSAQTE